MAGDWIKIEVALPDKPEVWAISEELDMEPDAVVGKLIRVWSWFDTHTTSGNAPSVTKRLLDREVGVTGFTNAMQKYGWLVQTDAGITMPNFDRHNSKSAKNRALGQKRTQKHRNAPNVTSALPEKRREEKRIYKDKDIERGKRKPKKTGSRLAPDWQPDEKLMAWATKERPDLDITKTIESFIDYWIAKTGQAATKLDWDATFRNWVRKENGNQKTRSGNSSRAIRENSTDRRAREADEHRARILGGSAAP